MAVESVALMAAKMVYWMAAMRADLTDADLAAHWVEWKELLMAVQMAEMRVVQMALL